MAIARRSIWTGLAGVSSLSLLLFIVVGTAYAHARVISATPAIGSTIAKPPTSVSVQTAENMKPGPQFSNLFVYGPKGDLISQGNATIPLNNPREMSVPIKAEGTGVYVVQWKTVSAEDGDAAQGAFVFTVGVSAATTPATTPAQQNSAPATPPSSAASPGTPVWVPIVAAIVALIAGLVAGMGIGRRRTAPTTLPQANGTVMREEEEKSRRP